jgi:hypothetical protein
LNSWSILIPLVLIETLLPVGSIPITPRANVSIVTLSASEALRFSGLFCNFRKEACLTILIASLILALQNKNYGIIWRQRKNEYEVFRGAKINLQGASSVIFYVLFYFFLYLSV